MVSYFLGRFLEGDLSKLVSKPYVLDERGIKKYPRDKKTPDMSDLCRDMLPV